jgi:hypothetical protein
MDKIGRFNVARKLEKRSLLIGINCVAALSIFFFGYDQGVMGGVNSAKSNTLQHFQPFCPFQRNSRPDIKQIMLIPWDSDISITQDSLMSMLS